MLMVTRRIGERIVIGEGVEIVITEIHRQSVRVAVKAPPGHVIFRGEVWDKIALANRNAAEAAAKLDDDKLAIIDALDAPSTSPASPAAAVPAILAGDDAPQVPSAAAMPPRRMISGLKPLKPRAPTKADEP